MLTKHPKLFATALIAVACLLGSCGGGDAPGGFDPGDVKPYTPPVDTTVVTPPADTTVITPPADSSGVLPGEDTTSTGPVFTPSGYSYSNPVYSEYASPDPTVIRAADGYFYSYSTGDLIHILRSKDLVHWEFVGRAFTSTSRPRWITTKTGGDAGIWAPDINYINGQYVLYYSLSGSTAEKGSFKGFGAATSKSPAGPFTDHGKILQDGEILVPDKNGVPTANYNDYTIDQHYWEEPDGSKWIIWGSFRGIFIMELTDDGLALKYPGDKTRITRLGCAQWEGSLIYRHGGYYYYIGSNGNPLKGENSDYRAQVARSTSLFGPYVSKDGKKLLGSDTMTPLLYSNSTHLAPGHVGEITTDDNGQDWIIYHCYIKGKTGKGRLLYLDRIDWSDDGWPVINGGNGPTTSSPGPYFK